MNERRLAGLSILLAGQMLFTAQVWAASWQSAVASKVSTEFDTNPSMSPRYPGGVLRVLYEPGYLLTGTEGANEFKAGVGIQIERSSDPALSRNRDSPNFNLGWLRQGEANTLGISYNYYEMAIRNGGINAIGPGMVALPIAGLDATGQGLSNTRTSKSLSGTWSSSLGERSKLSVDGSYEGVTYKGGGPFVDYALQTGGLRYSYELSEHNTPFIKVSGYRYVPSGGGSTIRLANALLGLDLKVENIVWTLQAGKFKDSQDNSGVHNSGALGSVEAHYLGQRNQLALSAGHMVWPSGLGGFVKVDQKKVSWIYALSEISNAGFDLEKDNYHYLEIRTVADSSTTLTGVWMERELNFYWKMRTYYQHRTSKAVGADGAYSNILGISFGYINPDF